MPQPPARRKRRDLRSASTQITTSGLLQFLAISLDAMLATNRFGSIIAVNESAEVIFGYARSELLGHSLEILLPERFRSAHIAHQESYFSAPRTRQMGTGLSVSGKRKDGTEFPVDISLGSLLIDEAVHVIATVRNVTVQQRMVKELAERAEDEQQLQMLKIILSATTENVSLHDKHGRYRFVCERLARQLGLQRSDFAGKTWQEVGLPVKFMQPFEDQFQKVMLTGQTCVDELLFPSGAELRWFE